MSTINKFPTKVIEVGINELVPNKWNPNVQSEKIHESVKKSIERYGMINNLLVREYVGQYQIIAGEHRWRICKELGYTTLKVDNLGEIKDDDAKALTELLNTSGEDDPIKQAKLFRELQQNHLSLFPLTNEEIENKKKLIDFDFSKYEKEEVVEEKRNRVMAFPLSEAEYEIVRHALSLTKKDQTAGLMMIVKEYLEIREEIMRYNTEKQGVDNSS